MYVCGYSVYINMIIMVMWVNIVCLFFGLALAVKRTNLWMLADIEYDARFALVGSASDASVAVRQSCGCRLWNGMRLIREPPLSARLLDFMLLLAMLDEEEEVVVVLVETPALIPVVSAEALLPPDTNDDDDVAAERPLCFLKANVAHASE